MRRLKYLSVGIFLCHSLAFGEIQNFGYETLNLRLGVQIPAIPLTIDSTSTKDDSLALEYRQNTAPKLGLGFDWGDFGTYLSFLNLSPQEDVKKFGKTKYFDLQFHFYVANWGFDLWWQNFKGYYLENTKEVDPTYYAANGNLIRDDITSSFVGFNLSYVRHPDRLSYAAALSGAAIQNSHGGSWSLLAGYTDQQLGSDGTLAPDSLSQDYGSMGNIKHAKFRTISLGGGYGQTWVFWKTWYFHGSLSLAFGPQFQSFAMLDWGATRDLQLAFKGLLRIALGSNGKRYFGGLAFNADGTGFRVDDKTLQFSSELTFLYFGVRFEI